MWIQLNCSLLFQFVSVLRIHLLEDDWFGIGVVRLGSTGKPLLGIGIDVVRLGSTGKPRLASGLEWFARGVWGTTEKKYWTSA